VTGVAAVWAALQGAPWRGVAAAAPDPRNIRHGWTIPDEGYCDQPYVVVTDAGDWLCVLTTGPGEEGDARQHIVATRSRDFGRTWTPLVDIEPPGPPEASWVMPLKTPGGRIYVFYVYNGDGVRSIGDRAIRADMLGHYVFRCSHDHGHTWSPRQRIPLRATAVDRENDFAGAVQMFWGVGKPIVAGDSVYLGLSKIGRWLVDRTEGFFLYSPDLLAARDPAGITWQLLPEGDRGLRAPRGAIAEEHNLVALDRGGLYCVYRTVDGFLCAATSGDCGRSWSAPAYAAYLAGGRPIKNPRGPAFVKKAGAGRYLLTCYNHGGTDFDGRNPLWIAGGIQREGTILWSEPEICLYDDDPATRIGYPDLIEQDGRWFLTETQKRVARVHELDPTLLAGLWEQPGPSGAAARDGCALDLRPASTAALSAPAPQLPRLAEGGGFALELRLRSAVWGAGRTLLDARDDRGRGVALLTAEAGSIELVLSDGQLSFSCASVPGPLAAPGWHHFVAIADGGPAIVTFVVDGVLDDGGTARQRGWHRFDRALADVNGAARMTLARPQDAELARARIYTRYLRTSEAVGNYRAGMR